MSSMGAAWAEGLPAAAQAGRQLLQSASETTRQSVIDYYHYYPSRALAIVALSLFLAITAVIAAILLKARRHWFMVIVVITGLCEVAGYICRLSFMSTPVYGAYVAMQCFLIISPTFLALVNYIIVGRIMRIAGAAKIAFLKPNWVYIFFFASDLVSLGIQGAGAGLSVSPDDIDTSGPGNALLLLGLGLQLGFFGCFAAVAVYMHVSPKYGLAKRRDLNVVFWCLYLTTALLFIRNTYRVVEFAQGWHGYLADHEVFFYCLDALIVFMAFVVYAALHPSLHLPLPGSAAPKAADRDIEMNEVEMNAVSA